jgi:tetratricopeptide (TPR) repeat protein
MEQINYYERGLSKEKLEDYEGAIEEFTKAIELSPNDSNAYTKIGFSKIYIGDSSDSEDFIKGANIVIIECSKIIENEPENPIAYYKRGDAKKQLNKYVDAKIDFTKAIDLNPNDANVYIKRALLIKETDNLQCFNEAIADCTIAIELINDKALGYFRRGDVKKMMEDFKGAIEDYSMAIEFDPNNYRYYMRRWTVRNMYGDIDGASEDLMKINEIKINHIKNEQ